MVSWRCMPEEIAQCLDSGEFMGHQASVQKAVVDLYGTKISVILAEEVLDALLLRISVEINDGPLAIVLNMAQFPVLELRFDHM